jgi:hypothetical protein
MTVMVTYKTENRKGEHWAVVNGIKYPICNYAGVTDSHYREQFPQPRKNVKTVLALLTTTEHVIFTASNQNPGARQRNEFVGLFRIANVSLSAENVLEFDILEKVCKIQ